MGKSNNSSNKSTTSTSIGSPIKKAGRKPITGVLQYSPRERLTRVNKVFVVGTQFGIILMRTEKQNSKDDAYTNDVIKMIEDETSGVAAKLQIVKICSRRQSQQLDKAILQTSVYPSQWFVTIMEEEDNTEDNRKQHAETFINFLNDAPWKYPQLFTFAGDETKLMGDKIIGTLDEYLLNQDIAIILKTYVFEDFESFLEDEEAIKQVFGKTATKHQTRNWLVDGWIKNGNQNM
jgi:hypothetical protein